MQGGSGGLGQLGQEQGWQREPLLTAPAIGHQLVESTIRPSGAEPDERLRRRAAMVANAARRARARAAPLGVGGGPALPGGVVSSLCNAV